MFQCYPIVSYDDIPGALERTEAVSRTAPAGTLVKITGDYYAHYRPGQKRHIMDRLDERGRRAAQQP